MKKQKIYLGDPVYTIRVREPGFMSAQMAVRHFGDDFVWYSTKNSVNKPLHDTINRPVLIATIIESGYRKTRKNS